MLKNIKGAIFDMDGTLIDSLIVWDVIWKKFGEMFLQNGDFRPDQKDDKAVRTMTLKDAMYYLHSIYGIGNSGAELLEAANETMRNFYADEVEVKPGVVEFLEYCYANGVKMCVASATDIGLIKIAMAHCRLEKYFPKIFSCAEIGKGKDEPDIYLQAVAYLGTGIEETCVFEDSHIAIKTANKIGTKTVGIYDKNNYGQEEMKKIADVYVEEGETLLKLLK
jgi:HAD superfamily hydrolase (TIGR01509 family)